MTAQRYDGGLSAIGRELALLSFVDQEIQRLEGSGAVAPEETAILRSAWRSRRWELYNLLYETAQRQQRWRVAYAAARSLLRRAPHDQRAQGRLGLALLRIGDNVGALDALRRAVVLGNRDGELGSALADLYAAQGDTAEALLALWATDQTAQPGQRRHNERADALIGAVSSQVGAATPPPASRHLRDSEQRLDYFATFLASAMGTGAISVATKTIISEQIARRQAALRPAVAMPSLPPPVPELPIAIAPQTALPSPVELSALPARKPFNWADVWSGLFSERMLRALLYLGATLLVVSVSTWVTFNWQTFSPIGQLAVLSSVASAFYASGALLRKRYRLDRSGMALTAIGAGWVPAIGWMLTRPGLLDLVPGQSWLLISALCLLAYTLSIWWLRVEFFAALVGLSAINVLLASLHLAAIAPSGQGAALLLLLTLFVALAHRLRTTPTNRPVAAPLLWIAHGLVPIVLVGGALFWRATPTDLALLALTWWLGCAFYLISLRLIGGIGFEQAAVWAAPAALLFSIEASNLLSPAWYAVGLLALAILYFWIAQWRHAAYLLTHRPWLRYPLVWPNYNAAYLLALIALLWPEQTTASSLVSALGATALCALSASRFKRVVWAWLACATGFWAATHLLSLLALDSHGMVSGWTLIAYVFWFVGVALARAPRFGSAPLSVGYATLVYGICMSLWLGATSERIVLPLAAVFMLASGGFWLMMERQRYGYALLINPSLVSGLSFALATGCVVAWLRLLLPADLAPEVLGFGQLLVASLYMVLGTLLRDHTLATPRRALIGASDGLLASTPLLLWFAGDQTALVIMLVASSSIIALFQPALPHVHIVLPWHSVQQEPARVTPLDLLALLVGLAMLPFALLWTKNDGLLMPLLTSMGCLLLGAATLYKRPAGIYAAGSALLAAGLVMLRWLDLSLAGQSAGLAAFALLIFAAALFYERRKAFDWALAFHTYGYGSVLVVLVWSVSLWSPRWLHAPWELAYGFSALFGAAFVLALRYRNPSLGAASVALVLPAFLATLSAANWPLSWYSPSLALLAALYFMLAVALLRGWLGGRPLFATPLLYGGHALALLALLLGTPATGSGALAALVVALAYAWLAAMQRIPPLAAVPAALLPLSATWGWMVFGEASLGSSTRSLLWLALSCASLGVGMLVRQRRASAYSLPFYIAAFLLGIGAWIWSSGDRVILLAALAGQILLWIGWATLNERGALWSPKALPSHAGRLFTKLLLVPIAPLASFWLVLLCDTLAIDRKPAALALALLALGWVLVARALRRLDGGLPFLATALGLSLLAPVMSDGALVQVVLLASNVAIFMLVTQVARQVSSLASTLFAALLAIPMSLLTLFFFSQTFSPWLPPVLVLALIACASIRIADRRPLWSAILPLSAPPLLLTSIMTYQIPVLSTRLSSLSLLAGVLMVYALASFLVSWWIERRWQQNIATNALTVASACCGIWIICFDGWLFWQRTPVTTLAVLALVPLYSLFAYRLRSPIWLYAALLAGLLLRTDLPALLGVPIAWRGVALLVGTALFFAIGTLLHGHIGKKTSLANHSRLLSHEDGLAWALPLYLIAHMWALRGVTRSLPFEWPLVVSLFGVTLLYAISAWIWRSRLWQWAALVGSQATYLALLFALHQMQHSGQLALALLPFGSALAAAGLLAEWRYLQKHTAATAEKGLFWSAEARWAHGLYFFAALNLGFALDLAIMSRQTLILTIVAFVIALLLATLGSVWRKRGVLLAALLLGALGCDAAALHTQASMTQRVVLLGSEGLLFWWAGFAQRWLWGRTGRSQSWADALRWGGIGASGIALISALVPLAEGADTRPLIGALALAGLLVVGHALIARVRGLSYLGSAMLLAAWMLTVFSYLPDQPQYYTLPAGCYLLAISAAERQRGAPTHQAQLLDLLGMSVLLAVTFWQSLPSNLNYGVLVGCQALLLVLLGAMQRVRLLFFGGIIAFLLTVALQSMSSIQQVEKSLLAFVVGLMLVAAAIYVERRREVLLQRTRSLIAQFETWQ